MNPPIALNIENTIGYLLFDGGVISERLKKSEKRGPS